MQLKMLEENNTICLDSEPSKNWLISEIASILHEQKDIEFVESMYHVLKNDIAAEDTENTEIFITNEY